MTLRLTPISPQLLTNFKTNNMKTGKEWLAELPEPYKSEIEENIREQDLMIKLNSNYDSLAYFIRSAFIWAITKQGWIYWNDLHDKRETGYYWVKAIWQNEPNIGYYNSEDEDWCLHRDSSYYKGVSIQVLSEERLIFPGNFSEV